MSAPRIRASRKDAIQRKLRRIRAALIAWLERIGENPQYPYF